jgi:hemerythrin-like domain-containing protein
MLEFLKNDQKGKKAEKSKEGADEALQAGADALSILKSQHREIEELFSRVESAYESDARGAEDIFSELAAKIDLHTQIEEKIFYPEAADIDNDAVVKSFEEHAIVKELLRKLERGQGGTEVFKARVSVLKELIEHHVEEEENDLFPKCEKELGDEALKDIGARIQAMMSRGVRSTPKRKAAATRKARPTKAKGKAASKSQAKKKAPAAKAKKKSKKRRR